PMVEGALRRACRMAELTSKPVWIERMLGFAGSIHVVLPAPLIDQLQALLKQTPLAVRPALEDYLSKVTTQMSWNEQTRFLVARIEQLRLLVPRSFAQPIGEHPCPHGVHPRVNPRCITLTVSMNCNMVEISFTRYAGCITFFS